MKKRLLLVTFFILCFGISAHGPTIPPEPCAPDCSAPPSGGCACCNWWDVWCILINSM